MLSTGWAAQSGVAKSAAWQESHETNVPVDCGLGSWDNPTMIVTLDAKRRVSIPVGLAPADPGDQFDASFDAETDVVTLRRIKRKTKWLKVWRQCPALMDEAPSRSKEYPKKIKP